MNDRWIKTDGTRWNEAERIRVSRLFRAHVDTPSNRRTGRSCRIQRRNCFWHPNEAAEAHHIRYDKPFVVVWACVRLGCHREIDHGSKKIPRKAVFDYTSLVEGAYGVAKHGLRKPEPESRGGCTCARRARTKAMRERGQHLVTCPKFVDEPQATRSDDATPF